MNSILNGDASEAISKAKTIDSIKPADVVQYEVCFGMWYNLFCDICAESNNTAMPYQLLQAVRTRGLFDVIASADAFAHRFLLWTDSDSNVDLGSETDSLTTLWFSVVYLVYRHHGVDLNDHGPNVADCVRTTLQLLRFPKRFTISEPGGDVWEKFSNVCRETRDVENVRYYSDDNRDGKTTCGPVLKGIIAEWIRELIVPNGRHLTVFNRRVRNIRGKFSSGSKQAVGTDRPAAYNDLISHGITWRDQYHRLANSYTRFPTPATPLRGPIEITPISVPKDYSERRIVNPEPAILNWVAGEWRRVLELALEETGWWKFIRLEDSTDNRDLAVAGSVPTGNWCTLDLSSGSDRINRNFFFSVLPWEYRGIRNAISDRVHVPGHGSFPTPMFATAGSPLTPVCQSILFLALGLTACTLCGIHGRFEDHICVYNDDIICSERIVITLMELLTTCGLKVNEKKSFFTSSSRYRESCGGEYYWGQDVTPKYWVRKPLPYYSAPADEKQASDNAGTIKTLIEMQHRFFYVPHVSAFLTQVVLKLFPRMTYSCVNSICDDLWSQYMTALESEQRPHQEFRTTRKYRPTTVELKNPALNDYIGVEACDRDDYYSFLESGPVFDDPLMELLGVTTPRARQSQLRGDVVHHWSKRASRVKK